MDPLDFLEDDALLQFFRRHKTELSLTENPRALLTQLRDHNLIPEDRYKSLTRMRTKERVRRALYDLLDWLETRRPQHVHLFWSCVFKETILTQYPHLRLLRNSLLDGSYQDDPPVPEKVETDDGDEDKKKVEDQKKKKKTKMERRRRTRSIDSEDEEQPGPSSAQSPTKRTKKITFSSPLKKGERGDIWLWPIYKDQLPVTCGDQKGLMQRDRLARGEPCIMVDSEWFTPSEFERLCGRRSSRNWKQSVLCSGTSLGKLIQEGHLKAASFKRGAKKRQVQRSLFGSGGSGSAAPVGPEEEEEEQEEEEEEPSSSDTGEGDLGAELHPDVRMMETFRVSCGSAEATLHRKRFASGTCGRSIRTETSWLTPEEFCQASCQTDTWRKDIRWDGRPLSALIQGGILNIHSPLCDCSLCVPEDLDQRNDDVCIICRGEDGEGGEGGQLVVCDSCPRSFHPTCHLPHVQDALLGDDTPWHCTFCVFKHNQRCLRSDHEASVLSRQISACMLACQYLLLVLRGSDEDQLFSPDLSHRLDGVTQRLQGGGYRTVGQFVSDLRLIFPKQNNSEAQDQLQKTLEENLKTAFNIRETTQD